jgi:ligand-binding sensor domain-containing protein
VNGGGGGGYVPPDPVDRPLVHAPATPISVSVLPGAPLVYDVGADRGGGLWAAVPSTVYYWPTPSRLYRYNQSSGLARGNASFPFASVAGGLAGEAYVGNRGAIGDHLVVNPSTGAVVKIENMHFSCSASDIECQEQLVRVTAGLRMVVDFNGTFNGTVYNGGVHGVTAWHGVDGPCGCLQFEQHQHYIPRSGCDSTVPQQGCWGGDTVGLAFSPQGDLWIGDEHFVALLPQRSLGPNTDFFTSFTLAVDVFPGANDEVHGLAVDGAGGVWVASFGQGLAYLAPMTLHPSYFDRSRELPQNRLTAVAIDPSDGSLWVGTSFAGIARKQGATWRYYTGASGLPSDDITALYMDTSTGVRRVLIGTDAGVGVYTGP